MSENILRVTNSSVRRNALGATFVLSCILSLFMALVNTNRAAGTLAFFHSLITDPFKLLRVRAIFLVLSFWINFIIAACVKLYIEERLNKRALCALTFIAISINMFTNTTSFLRNRITQGAGDAAIALVISFFSSGVAYMEMTDPQNFFPLASGEEGKSPGLLNYFLHHSRPGIFYKHIAVSSAVILLLSGPCRLGTLGTVMYLFRGAYNMSLFALMFFIVSHTYIYNVKFFSRNIPELKLENSTGTAYNKIVVTNYLMGRKGRGPAQKGEREKSERDRKHAEVVFAYFTDTLDDIKADIEALVKSQAAREELSPLGGSKAREMPTIFVARDKSEKKGRRQKMRSAISSRTAYILLFSLVSKALLKRSYEKAQILAPVMSFVKEEMGLPRRRKAVEAISALKSELLRLEEADAINTLALLTSWIVTLEK
jgi:hypothetical protein